MSWNWPLQVSSGSGESKNETNIKTSKGSTATEESKGGTGSEKSKDERAREKQEDGETCEDRLVSEDCEGKAHLSTSAVVRKHIDSFWINIVDTFLRHLLPHDTY